MRPTSRIIHCGALMALVLSGLMACGTESLSTPQHVAKAKEYIEKGVYSSAFIELLNAVQKTPDSLEARSLLGQVSIKLGDGERAEKEIRRAGELGLASQATLPLLAQALFIQGKYDDLIVETANLATGTPQSDEALLYGLRGQAYLEKEDFERAKASFTRALEIDPNALTALVGLGRLYGKRGQLDEARRWTQRAIDVDSSYPDAWSQLGEIDLAQGHTREATVSLSNAIKYRMFPTLDLARRALANIEQGDYVTAQNDIDTLKQKGFEKQAYVRYIEGYGYFRQKKYPEAIEALEASLNSLPTYLPTKIYLGAAYLQQGKLEQALRLAKEVNAAAPGSLQAKRMLGTVYMMGSDLDAAKKEFQVILNHDDKDLTALRMLATLSLMRGDGVEGAKYLHRILQLEPDSQQAKHMLMLAKVMSKEEPRTEISDHYATSGTDDYTRDFLEALNSFKRKRFNDALERAQRLHKAYPDRVDPINLMAAAHLGLGEADKARTDFENALKVSPNDSTALKNLARMELQKGEAGQAKVLAEKLLAVRPEEADAIGLLAQAESRLGNEARALQLLEETVRRNPGALNLRLSLARKYYDAGDFVQLLALTRDVSEDQAKEQPALLELRGKAESLSGDIRSAKNTFGRWVLAAPKSADAHLWFSDSLARTGEMEKAHQELRKAIQIDPKFLPARIGEVKVLAALEKKQAAREAFAILKKDFGERAEVKAFEGWLALQDREFQTAERLFTEARKTIADTELTLLLVKALWGQEKYDQALNLMNAWLQDHPKDITVLLHMAGAYLSLHNEEEARPLYAKVVELAPNHAPALNNLAWLSRDIDIDQAITYAERAHALLPKDPSVLDTLGTLLLKKGDIERGAAMIREAAERSPGDSDIQLHLGQALIRLGKHEEAQTVLSPLITKSPGSKVAGEARGLLGMIPKN